jgi:hypothetical protein
MSVTRQPNTGKMDRTLVGVGDRYVPGDNKYIVTATNEVLAISNILCDSSDPSKNDMPATRQPSQGEMSSTLIGIGDRYVAGDDKYFVAATEEVLDTSKLLRDFPEELKTPNAYQCEQCFNKRPPTSPRCLICGSGFFFECCVSTESMYM